MTGGTGIDYFVEIAVRGWFEIGFDWVCFGFVFEAAAEAYIDIIHC